MAEERSSLSPVHKLLVTQVLVVAILLFSGFAYMKLYGSRDLPQQADLTAPDLNVDVFQVQQADFQEIIYGFGTVQADQEVVVAAQVTGQVIEVSPELDVGRSAKARQLALSSTDTIEEPGDLLIRIDPKDYLQRQQQALSRIEEAKVELQRMDLAFSGTKKQLAQSQDVLKTLKAEYERIKSAMRRQASSESELDRSLLEVQRYEESILQFQNQLDLMPAERSAAEQRLTGNEAEAQQATNDLERTRIIPPFDGIISDVQVALGQFVRSGEPLFRLTDLRTVEIPVALAQDEFLRLQTLQQDGMKPPVQLQSGDTTSVTWKGDLVRVAPEADTESRTVQVFIEVANTPDFPLLLPGTFVTAAIDGPVTNNSFLVPREAIVSNTVYVVSKENLVVQRPVVVQRIIQAMAVVEGVQLGDLIAVTNLDLLMEGQQVNVQRQLTLEEEISGLRKNRIRLLSQPENE